MKNSIKLFEAIRRIAIIAMVAIIGFSMAACDSGGGGTTLAVRIVRIPNSGDETVVSGGTASLADMWRLEVQFHKGDNNWGYWRGSSDPSTKWYLNGTEITTLSYEDELYPTDIPSAKNGDKIKVEVTYQSRDSKGNLLNPATVSAETTLTN